MKGNIASKTNDKRLRILLVEDNEESGQIESSLLQELGHSCDIAFSGTEALEKLARAQYDLVMMDLELPDISGLDAAKRIRDLEKEANLPPTPILGITGRATLDDQILCQRAGMDDYLSKPFRLTELEKKLEAFR